MAKISKRKKAANEIDRSRSYPLSEAVAMIKASASASKFDETIEIAMNLGVCLLYTSPSPRDQRGSRMPSSA